jgi:hypothetical protein
MFIAIRKYRVRRGSMEEWAQRVQDGFVPLLRELAGFRGYYLLRLGAEQRHDTRAWDAGSHGG